MNWLPSSLNFTVFNLNTFTADTRLLPDLVSLDFWINTLGSVSSSFFFLTLFNNKSQTGNFVRIIFTST